VSLKKLGRYDLVRVLGKGAMGVVYEGRDPNLERRVAIKTVKVENLSEEAAAEYEHRFRTEARSAARLQHPNIVSVYDSDRDGDIAFLVMEYIQGDDLKHHLDKGARYSLEQVLKMVRDLLSALDYAHKQGIVHRDIKPANLLIEPGGRVKLTDFGVARIQDSGEATRTQGSMVGTLKYMAPEQVQGQKIDSRADLFSVGVVLYQLLTDKRPFDGDNDFSIIHQIIGHNPPPPSSFNSRLPSAIDAVVARALAKDREQRFGSARDFASALQSAIRRAEDATIVPPADPFKKADAAGTGSKSGQQSIAGIATSPSTVTQEVELVYWKDIKDSTDAEEFESFLQKFPAGIYADLARRRLRKITGVGTPSPDQTVLSGAAGPAESSADPDQDLEATRLRTGTRPLVVAAAVAPTAPQPEPPETARPEPAGDPSPDYTRTIVEPRHEEAAMAAPPVAHETEEGAPTFAPTLPGTTAAPALANTGTGAAKARGPAKPATKKPSMAVLAGLGALAIAGLAAIVMAGKGLAPDKGSMAAAVPAASAAASSAEPEPAAAQAEAAAPPASTASLPAPEVKTVVTAVSAAHPASKSSAPRSAVVARPKTAPASQPVEPPRTVTASPAPQREPTRTPSAPAAVAQNPAEACKDKVFISREFCLADACEKPAGRNHPLCVKWRDDRRLREASKIREGQQNP
jgi:eukaryotic-like serine/threonine-protein kinase